MSSRYGIAAALSALILLLLAPAVAQAGTASVSGSTLNFSEDAAGEVNALTFDYGGAPGTYTLADSSTSLTAGVGCVGGGASVTCGSALLPIDRMAVDLGAGDDSFTGLSGLLIPAIFQSSCSDPSDVAAVSAGAGTDTVVLQGQASDPGALAGAFVIDNGDDNVPGSGTIDASASDQPLYADGGPAGVNSSSPGTYRIYGSSAADSINGCAGTDLIYGNAGDDSIRADTAYTGSGFFIGSPDTVDGGSGNDVIEGGQGADDLTGNLGDDELYGRFIGQNNLADGADLLDGGPGADEFAGQGGADTISYSDRTADLTVTLDGNANDGEAGEGDFVPPTVGGFGDNERIVFGSGQDTLTGVAGGMNGRVFLLGSGDDLAHDAFGTANIIDCGPGTDDATDTDANDTLIDCNDAPPPANQPPTALIDVTVAPNDCWALSGSGSSDPDGDPLTYRWLIDGQEVGAGSAYFDCFDQETVVELEVSDPSNATDTDTVTLTPAPPPANQAPTALIDAADVVGNCWDLDGSGSSDPDGDALTYTWKANGSPVSSSLSFRHCSDAQATVTLTVTDPSGATDTDQVVLTPDAVVDPEPPVITTVTPPEGSPGDPVTVIGEHFCDDKDPQVAENVVTFDGQNAVVLSESRTEIGVITPIDFQPGQRVDVRVICDGTPSNDVPWTVRSLKPIANAIAEANPDDAMQFAFDGSSSVDPDGGEIKQHVWRYEDRVVSRRATFTRTFASEGSKVLVLTVVDDEGDRDTARVRVQPNEPTRSVITLPGILFDYDSHKLRRKAQRQLREVRPYIAGASRVKIRGYASDEPARNFPSVSKAIEQSTEQHNLRLSDDRAHSVGHFLLKKLSKAEKPQRLRMKGYGEDHSYKKLARNRRVEIVIFGASSSG